MGKKRVTYEDLVRNIKAASYAEEAEYIMDLISKGRVAPVKSSGTNGKKPAMYRRYWLFTGERDYSDLLEELRYRLSPRIDIEFYRRHPDIYEKERDLVLKLDGYITEKTAELSIPLSENERSYAIWGMEKFLSGRQDSTSGISASNLLRHCGITADELNTYRTTEPMAYYTREKTSPQNLLILENLDPFYGMRKHLMSGKKDIFDIRIDSLIYGGGKRVSAFFEGFESFAEPYMKDPDNIFYYFGDLDHEGIGIYEAFSARMKGRLALMPFCEAYIAMLEGVSEKELPFAKKGQNQNHTGEFFTFFKDEEKEKMQKILDSGRYIPQEKLNILSY